MDNQNIRIRLRGFDNTLLYTSTQDIINTAKRINKEGAISGMIVGIVFTTIYIFYFKPQLGGPGLPENYLFGITPEGIGTIGMVINFIVSLIVSRLTKPTPNKIKNLVESIRYPK